MSDWVVVGKLLGPFGIKGWIKLYSHTHPIENIGQYSPLWAGKDGHWQPINVLAVQRQGKGLIARVEGCDDRNAVPRYTGLELAIQRSQLPQLANNDFYWADLVGLQVDNLEHQCLGQVSHLMETGANDVLVVNGCNNSLDQRQRLIPYVWQNVVKQVDIEAGVIRVDWPADF